MSTFRAPYLLMLLTALTFVPESCLLAGKIAIAARVETQSWIIE